MTVPVPSKVAPSLNCTVPVAVDGVTTAVSATLCPTVDGFTLVVSVTAPTAFTTCAIAVVVVAGALVVLPL